MKRWVTIIRTQGNYFGLALLTVSLSSVAQDASTSRNSTVAPVAPAATLGGDR
jgi:hypothetical protein